MATMTISEAEHVLDIVFAAFADTSHRHHPISALKGYDIYQICTASKLLVANEFLLLAERSDFQERFAEGLKFYDAGIPWLIIMNFVQDNQVDSIGADLVFDPIDHAKMTFKDKRMASEETATSFGDFCKSLGSKDPIYWQKIYTRLGLEYTSESPKANHPVFPH